MREEDLLFEAEYYEERKESHTFLPGEKEKIAGFPIEAGKAQPTHSERLPSTSLRGG